MPRSAIENVDVDPANFDGTCSVEFNTLAEEKNRDGVYEMENESDIAELEVGAMQITDRPGTPLPCPVQTVLGVLWEIKEGKPTQFRCRW